MYQEHLAHPQRVHEACSHYKERCKPSSFHTSLIITIIIIVIIVIIILLFLNHIKYGILTFGPIYSLWTRTG